MMLVEQHITLRGLTWDHRRAIAPLQAVQAAFTLAEPNISIDWSVRDLRQFEHQSLEEVASSFDLILFDHPFVGRMAASGAFSPVDDVLMCVAGATDAAYYAGPSLASYRLNGQTWGVPVDAATMHAVYRADLLANVCDDIPVSWSDVINLGRRVRKAGLWLGLANGDHHGFLAVGSLMHNLGAGWATGNGEGMQFSISGFRQALSCLRQATAFAPPQAASWNSIALHDAMTTRDDIVYCPLTFGYATYGEEDFCARRLKFSAAPGLLVPYASGTLLGGAAIGLSVACKQPDAAKKYLSFVLQPDIQTQLFGKHHGQPAALTAWEHDELDTRFNGYFKDVYPTLTMAATRPRFDGYGRFEKYAGALVSQHLQGEISENTIIEHISKLIDQTRVGSTAP